jgi:hypothetical protein
MTERKVLQFRLTARDIENLEYVSTLINPTVSASDALRSGLELFCNKQAGDTRRALPPSPAMQKAIEEGKTYNLVDCQLEGEDLEKYKREKEARGYVLEK